MNLIYSLVNHKGSGSLQASLKTLNYTNKIELELNTEVTTAFRFVTIQISLTPNGIKNWRTVLALTLEYFRKVKDEWLDNG